MWLNDGNTVYLNNYISLPYLREHILKQCTSITSTKLSILHSHYYTKKQHLVVQEQKHRLHFTKLKVNSIVSILTDKLCKLD